MDKTPIDAITLLADSFPSDSPRLLHSLGVANKMSKILNSMQIGDQILRSLCISSAVLHDIGYSEDIAINNFHPVDGYLYLIKEGYDPKVAEVVLHHSYSEEFVRETRPDLLGHYEGILLDERQLVALRWVTYCDLHTSANGDSVSWEERYDSIKERYGSESSTYQIMNRMLPNTLSITEEVESRLGEIYQSS